MGMGQRPKRLYHRRPGTTQRDRTFAGVIAKLRGAFPEPAWHEATLEAAPGTLTVESVQAWQLAGINRISLGVQSFIKSELARTIDASTTGLRLLSATSPCCARTAFATSIST